MGVTGLWRLIEPTGKPVPVETLENKVLAVDISIWLHQMVKGYQDAKGAPLPNAHLIGLFQRLCKLLYFRIKPVFVFDGAFPDLKKETIAKRQDNKTKYNSASEKLKREIALLLGKKSAISALLGKQISPSKPKQPQNHDDIFKLPDLPEKCEYTDSESESDDEQNSSASTVDLHTVDLESDKFKNMPVKDKYDMLIELKETRKMNSWGKINTLPKKSDNFSDFQMQRLLKRRKLQECLEETEKEMGDEGMSLNELESLLNEEGIETKIESLPSRRIASNNTTRFLLISNVKQALENAKRKEEAAQKTEINNSEKIEEMEGTPINDFKAPPMNDELEDDLQKAIKMSLECVDEADTSHTSKTDESWTSYLSESEYSDDEDNDGFEQPDMSSAKSYIKQYTDLTHKVIDCIVAPNSKDKKKPTKPNIYKIIEELEMEKTIIEDHIAIMTSEDDETDKNVDTIPNNISNKEKDFTDKPESGTFTVNKTTYINAVSVEQDCENMNYANASVICIDKSNDNVISLDSSTKDITIDNLDEKSSSSEDDFEEVSDKETENKNSVIQLTLNMGCEVEDDIFADIFTKKDEKKVLNSCISTKSSEIEEEKLLKEVKSEDKKQKCDEPKDIIKSTIPIAENEMSKTLDIHVNKVYKENANVISQLNVDQDISNSELTATSSKPKTPEKPQISTEELASMVLDIENEEQVLIQEKGRLDRIGRNITEQMTKEAQELLQIFGIPYIVAPMEAEAQCAFLESHKLIDGTITDDSDIWLFGGNTVYKNFFNQKKNVLQFLRERIERSFNLNREKLVLLALLVGSDYTLGVNGVGPVTALEILASFPFNNKKIYTENPKNINYQEVVAGLQDFKKWVRAGKRTDNISLKKKLKNVNLSQDFPSLRVVQAYFEPTVEKSEEKFSWGNPDITELRDYAKAKFGWSQNKLDEIIKPVIKRMKERKSQKTVHDYFKRKIIIDSLDDQLSKRVKAAVEKLGPDLPIEETSVVPETERPKQKRKTSTDTKSKAGPSRTKRKKTNDEIKQIIQVVKSPLIKEPEEKFDIIIPSTDKHQEIIPQREKDRRCILENKLKAIEVFRKSKIDPKKKAFKRRLPVPKENAELSESSDSN